MISRLFSKWARPTMTKLLLACIVALASFTYTLHEQVSELQSAQPTLTADIVARWEYEMGVMWTIRCGLRQHEDYSISFEADDDARFDCAEGDVGEGS